MNKEQEQKGLILAIGAIDAEKLGTHKEVFNALKAKITFEEITTQGELDVALEQRVAFERFVTEEVAKNKARIAEIEAQEITRLKATNKVLENAYEVVKATIDESAIKFIDKPREDTFDTETGMIIPAQEVRMSQGLIVAGKPVAYEVKVVEPNNLWNFINTKCVNGVYKNEEIGVELEVVSPNIKALEAFAKSTKGKATIPGVTIKTIEGKIIKAPGGKKAE